MSYASGFIPVIPLKNAVLFPDISMPLRIGRQRSVKALQKSLKAHQWLVLLAQKDPEKKIEKPEDLYSIGTLCKIESSRTEDDGSFSVFVKAHKRVRAVTIRAEETFFEALTETVDDVVEIDKKTQEALIGSIRQIAHEVLDLLPVNTEKMRMSFDEIEDLAYLTHVCAANGDFTMEEKQNLLETTDIKDRAFKLINLLQGLKERLKVQAGIRERLTETFQQNQKESILREQMKVIREELGDNDSKPIEDYRNKISAAGMPEEALALAESQVNRLESMNSASPEYQMIRSHLDLMVGLPWSKSSPEKEINLDEAAKILDEDHFGLDDIKKRILQHLAVMKLRKSQQGSILIFVGPPGVGKTSLGKSIARALGKKYTRVSVGGVGDDSEIRGHRRTYIGALPGRVIAALKKTGENDPVFILDEIDKLSRSFHGDPSAALLEVLDPEQNSTFQDHYLDTPFDLSKVFFIATANSLESIPAPLLDRMEIIQVHGYTNNEKKQIALKYLWKKQLKEHGIEESQLAIKPEALDELLSHYTREAGVRDLQRKIATICKAMSLKIVDNPTSTLTVDVKDLEEIFGGEKYTSDKIEKYLPPGVVTGLAWTPVGGDILFVEAAQMPGKGQLILTGQLGEVMQESVKIALSLVKSHLPILDPLVNFAKKDIHVHVPAGAIPKDGPSAGVTMLTAIASLLLKKPVDTQIAMTGEVSLRGAVLPVGGIKEKVIAAHRAGVRKIIVSRKNERNIKDVPEEIRKDLTFHLVDNVQELLKVALDTDFPYIDTPVVAPLAKDQGGFLSGAVN